MRLPLSYRGLSLILLLVVVGGPRLSLAQEEQILARGQVHYQRYCAVCHGAQGKGQGPLAAYLKLTPTDLTQLSKKNGGHFPFWPVYRMVDGRQEVRGHGTRAMPIWGEELRGAEKDAVPQVHEDLVAGRLWQLLSYLQSIQEQ
jgi:mono/diheme cytochrome c family protein